MARNALILSLILLTGANAARAGGKAPAATSNAAPAGDGVRSDGSDIGVAIMGAIVQRNTDDNVALIKLQTGVVKAVKKDHVLLDKYKVVAVHAEYIELVTRDAKRLFVYQDKFAGAFTPKTAKAGSGQITGLADQYKEDGFERVKGKVTMTAMYRDKLVKEDMAKVLMQATAEPISENGQIIGFKMTQIDEGSIYAKSGVTDGDIITSINGTELNSVAGSIALLRSLKGAEHIEVEVRRGGAPQKINVDVN